MTDEKQDKNPDKKAKKGRAGPGRPKDPERAERAEVAQLVTTTLPGMISTSLMNCCRRGDDEGIEKNLKAFVYAAKRKEAWRIVDELTKLIDEFPQLREKSEERWINVSKILESLPPKRQKLFRKTWKKIALKLNELEDMFNPNKLATFTYQKVAEVEGPLADRYGPEETLRHNATDRVKHAAHELDEIWDQVRYKRTGEIGELKTKKKTKKKT